MLSIRTNMASVYAQRNLAKAAGDFDDNVAKLSSGYRITKASDDAAGMAVSANLRAQVASYKMAARNAQDGVSLIQTAESALNESAELITRLRELTIQAASDGLGTTERQYLSAEVNKLTEEIGRIASTTEFNGRNLLSGAPTLQFQVGIRGGSSDSLSLTVQGATLANLGLAGASTFSSKFAAYATRSSPGTSYQALLTTLDDALESVSSSRATLGATANRLESAQNTIAVAMESAQQADSRIRDVDVAEESAKLGANQVLIQAGVSMLAQANQMPEAALELLVE